PTVAPAPGMRPGTSRATLWAAAFDARAPEPAIAVKHILGAEDYHAGAPDRFLIRLGPAELRNDACRGEVESGGHRIAWALRFAPAAREAPRAPWLLHHLPLPTRVAHANTQIACSARVEVRGRAGLECGSPSASRSLRVEAWCGPRTLAGYVYRAPAGWDVHVAQSDVASVTLELRRRPHPLAAWGAPRRLTCSEGAAL